MQVDADTLMQGELGQWLADQSSMREAAQAKANSRWLWSGGMAAAVLAIMWLASDWSFGLLVFLSFAIGIGVFIWGYLPIAEATHEIKVGINSAIAKSFGLSYEHDVEPDSEFEFARTYGLLPNYSRRTLEDHWFGVLEEHGFSLYEAHLEVQRGSGKNKRWVTVFRGALITMEFGRNFHSTTLLQRSGKHRSWLGFGGTKDEVSFSGHRLAHVEQVHPEFEDTFDLYSDDHVEARMLAHPAYIEHLLALESAFHGDAVRALFHEGHVIIAVESDPLFESGSMNADNDRERVEEAAQQFSSLAQLALAINQSDRGRAMGQV